MTVTVAGNASVPYRLSIPETGDYNLYKQFEGRLVTGAEDIAISVWIDRTTAEEQASQLAATEAARRARAIAEDAERRSATIQRVRLSSWTWREARDEITDADDSYLLTRATEYPSILERDASLVLRCALPNFHTAAIRASGVVLYVNADQYIGGDNPRVDFRFDEGAAVQGRRWLGSGTGTAVFVPSAQISALIASMKNASRLVFRVYDYRGVGNDYEFDVGGFADALSLLACYSGN